MKGNTSEFLQVILHCLAMRWDNFPLNKVNAQFCQVELIPFCAPFFISINPSRGGGPWKDIHCSRHLPVSPLKLRLFFF